MEAFTIKQNVIYKNCIEDHISSGVPGGGSLGCSNPPPKFRRYRWSPGSQEQEEPASRFPFVVHCDLMRL